MKSPYDTSYHLPLPLVQVALSNSDQALRNAAENVLLHTGSDGYLVPIALLLEIFSSALTAVRIRGGWGESRIPQRFVIDIEFNSLRLPGIFAAGCELGEKIILEHNALNKWRLFLDGPANLTKMPNAL